MSSTPPYGPTRPWTWSLQDLLLLCLCQKIMQISSNHRIYFDNYIHRPGNGNGWWVMTSRTKVVHFCQVSSTVTVVWRKPINIIQLALCAQHTTREVESSIGVSHISVNRESTWTVRFFDDIELKLSLFRWETVHCDHSFYSEV